MSTPYNPYKKESTQVEVLQNMYRQEGAADKLDLLSDIIKYANINGREQVYQSIPVINGRVLDLVMLFNEVVKRGGAGNVSNQKLWGDVAQHLNFPEVKPLDFVGYYLRYLMPYEQLKLPTSLSSSIAGKIQTSSHGTPRNVEGTCTSSPAPSSDIGASISDDTGMNIDEDDDDDDDADADAESGSEAGEDETKSSNVSTVQIKLAESITATPIALTTKRLRISLQKKSDLGAMHQLVLALDTNIKEKVLWALNQFTVLSYGSIRHGESDLLVKNVPGLLDALARQLESCQLHKMMYESEKRGGIFNLISNRPESHIVEGKALLILNILRNLSFTTQNEAPIGQHILLPQLLIHLLDYPNVEISEHALDILTCLVKYVGTKWVNPALVFPGSKWYGQDHSDTSLSPDQEKMMDRMLKYLIKLIESNDRTVIIRCCQSLSSLAQCTKYTNIFQDGCGSLFYRLIELLSISIKGPCKLHGTSDMYRDEPEIWAPVWDECNFPALGMGMIYSARIDKDKKHIPDNDLDYEVRDYALDALYYLSEHHDNVKLSICSQPNSLKRIAGVIASRVGRAETSRKSVGVLANLSMCRDAFPYFVEIEKDLVPIAFADETLSHILSNVLADVYGMHSL